MRRRNASPSWMSHRVGWCAPSTNGWPGCRRPCGCPLRAGDLFHCRRHVSADHTKPQRVTAGSPRGEAAQRRQTSGYGAVAGEFAPRPRHHSGLGGLRDPRDVGSWRQCRKAPSQEADVPILCGSVTLLNGGCSWGQSIKRTSPKETSARSSSLPRWSGWDGTSCPRFVRRFPSPPGESSSAPHPCQVDDSDDFGFKSLESSDLARMRMED